METQQRIQNSNAVITTEQPQIAVAPLTAAEWIAIQHKSQGLPRQFDDASVEYRVAYVGLDGVVIDHGRDVAIYPLPANVFLQAEQTVVINKSGAVVLPVKRAGIEGGKGRGA